MQGITTLTMYEAWMSMPVDFDDLTKRILDNLDGLNDKVDNLCDRMTKVEVNLDNHFNSMDQQQKGKERKFYYVIAIMGTAFTLFEVMRELL